ncbi:hypothetical protein TWF481_009013 [Arthrobotrys musiformis]|uniref:Pyridoxal phosphate homeostasis protein n=1 Tax=Arthrobotrys musiformis TaxID=47236 RepID=A0AAV9W2G5_9PEZI
MHRTFRYTYRRIHLFSHCGIRVYKAPGLSFQRLVSYKAIARSAVQLFNPKKKEVDFFTFSFIRRHRMADAEYEPGSEAAAGILNDLRGRIASDAVLLERSEELGLNIGDIRDSITAASQTAGAGEVVLIAVSKLKPASDILSLHTASAQRDFGENYIQELWKKHAILPNTIRWHFIGGLQTSAISKLARVENLQAVHSIDSVKKAVALNRLRPEGFAGVDVFVQVNTSGEDSKSGVEPDGEELWDLVATIRRECPRLNLVGLMTIGAIARSQAVKEGEENEDFVTLVRVARAVEERIEKEDGVKVVLKLSMGMSDDYENAIAMGAGYVRVGSSIFGARPKKADATIL